MDKTTRANLDSLHSDDGDARFAAYQALMAATGQPVDWAYAAWAELLAMTRDANNHRRAIATQLLCNLAQHSDPKRRMLKDFDQVLAVTHDKMFVTARHTLQSLWKVGTAGKKQQALVVERLAGRFADCAAEKNCTLIRYDIIVDLGQLYDAVGDESVKARALELIETEPDLKYRKKYATVFRRKKVEPSGHESLRAKKPEFEPQRPKRPGRKGKSRIGMRRISGHYLQFKFVFFRA